jgi:hypothetical protein
VAGGVGGHRWPVAGPVLAMIVDQHELPLPDDVLIWQLRRVRPLRT